MSKKTEHKTKQATWRIEKETEPQLKTNNIHLS